MLRQIDDSLWVVDANFKMFGIQLGGRMTVVVLPQGGVALISPTKWKDEYKAALDGLGGVAFILAPNLFHHMFVGEYLAAYPMARLGGAPGLEKKRADLPFHFSLRDPVPAALAGVLDAYPTRGIPAVNEVFFFHHASQTAIVTDWVFNHRSPLPFGTRLYLKLMAAVDHVNQPRLMRLMVKDRAKVQEANNQLLSWNPRRVICCHGSIIEGAQLDELRKVLGDPAKV